jgi:hypothetical protein
MQLLRNNQEWADSSLKEIGLESNVQDLKNIVDDMAESATHNPYLMNVLSHATPYKHNIAAVINGTSPEQIIDLIAYALVLEKMTLFMAKDVKNLKTIFNIWDKAAIGPWNVYKKGGLFFMIKYYSVRYPLGRFIEFAEQNKMPKYFLTWMIPFNILEAVFLDGVNGNMGNALSGLVLAKNCHSPRINPARLSVGRNIVEIRPYLPKKWADLYGVWNLGFVSQMTAYPYWFAKLLIPSVARYDQKPENYISYRTFALYSSLNYYFHAVYKFIMIRFDQIRENLQTKRRKCEPRFFWLS